MTSDGITGNARTITVVFQFPKIEHYSTTFHRDISLKIYAKIISIPFPRPNINLQLEIQSRPYKSLTKESKMIYLIEMAKNLKTPHNLPKSSHKMQIKNPMWKMKV